MSLPQQTMAQQTGMTIKMRQGIINILLALSVITVLLIVMLSVQLSHYHYHYHIRDDSHQLNASGPSRLISLTGSAGRHERPKPVRHHARFSLTNRHAVGGGGGGGGGGGDNREEEAGPSRQKYLIYLCDHVTSCGGWGDRQRGLVSAYLLAYLTGRRFGINMSEPCALTRFYVPRDVDWALGEDEVRGRTRRYIHSVGKEGKGSFHANLTRIDFNVEYPEDVVFLRTNVEHFWTLRQNPLYRKAFKTFPPWLIHGRPRFFEDAWRWLMQPAPQLRDDAVTMLTRMNFFNRTKPLVCAHVRIGHSATIPDETRRFNDIRTVGEVWKFLDPYFKNGSAIFLATDNMEVRVTSRQRYGRQHYDGGGLVLHVDKQRLSDDVKACTGFRYALLDQLILTLCDVLMTSNSQFSFRATLIRANVKSLYMFNSGKVKQQFVII